MEEKEKEERGHKRGKSKQMRNDKDKGEIGGCEGEVRKAMKRRKRRRELHPNFSKR